MDLIAPTTHSAGPSTSAADMADGAARKSPCTASPFEITAPPHGCSPEIAALFEHWRAIHPAEGLPARRHFDPLQVPRLLPHLWMLDLFRDPWRFRVRLLGTAIVEFIGRDDTSKWMHEVYADFERTDAFRCLSACARDGRPAYHKSEVLSNPEKSYVMAERICLPFAADGQTPDILLNMTLYRR